MQLLIRAEIKLIQVSKRGPKGLTVRKFAAKCVWSGGCIMRPFNLPYYELLYLETSPFALNINSFFDRSTWQVVTENDTRELKTAVSAKT